MQNQIPTIKEVSTTNKDNKGITIRTSNSTDLKDKKITEKVETVFEAIVNNCKKNITEIQEAIKLNSTDELSVNVEKREIIEGKSFYLPTLNVF